MTSPGDFTDKELASLEIQFVGGPVPRLITALRASREEVEHHEHMWTDLECRLREADETLSKMANSATSATDMKRLHSKAEGARLALSYLWDERRSYLASGGDGIGSSQLTASDTGAVAVGVVPPE